MSYNQRCGKMNKPERQPVEKVNPYPRKPSGNTKKELKRALDILVRLEQDLNKIISESNDVEDYIVRASWNARAPRGQQRTISGAAGQSIKAAEKGLIQWRTALFSKALPAVKKVRSNLAKGLSLVMMR